MSKDKPKEIILKPEHRHSRIVGDIDIHAKTAAPFRTIRKELELQIDFLQKKLDAKKELLRQLEDNEEVIEAFVSLYKET